MTVINIIVDESQKNTKILKGGDRRG